MNAYYGENKQVVSNKRIYDGFFTENARSESKLQKLLSLLFSFLFSTLSLLTNTTAKRIVKTTVVALSLVGIVGVIGAVECGTLGMGHGLLLGAVFIGIEFLCLYKRG